MSFTGPVMASFTMGALLVPQARRTIFLAARMVPQPMVMAEVGTFSSPPNACAASSRVMSLSWMALVSESFDEPGSLKPMCPERPMPRIWRSMPPASLMACSYCAQWAGMSASVISPEGMLMFSGLMSMWLKRFWWMNCQ